MNENLPFSTNLLLEDHSAVSGEGGVQMQAS